MQRAIAQYGTPQILNTHQGCQGASAEFTQRPLGAGIKLLMDRKGRCPNNVFVERLWRTVKYEEVYLKSYHPVVDDHTELETYFHFYTKSRPHRAKTVARPTRPTALSNRRPSINDRTSRLVAPCAKLFGCCPRKPPIRFSGRRALYLNLPSVQPTGIHFTLEIIQRWRRPRHLRQALGLSSARFE